MAILSKRLARGRSRINCSLITLIFLILGLKCMANYLHAQRQFMVKLERLHNYNSSLMVDDLTFDTYHRRILTFLNQRNISVSSYEQVDETNVILQRDINRTIIDLRFNQQQEILQMRNDQELARGCQSTCCWSRKKMKQFYNGEKNARSITLLDRLSQIDMKLLADIHYGDLPVPDNIQLPKLTNEILPCLQNNTVIFVDTTQLSKFFFEMHAKILVNYILLTGDSDIPCPFRIHVQHRRLLDDIFAGKTRIIHWFAMNCKLNDNETWKKSTLFSCLPQGIDQWSNQRHYMQIVQGKDDSIYNTHLKTNDYWILTSFQTEHASHYREPLWKLACHGRLKTLSKCFYRSYLIDQWRYHIHLAQSKFVFSPPGDGMDCYRTWEALYLGTIPIILQLSINSIFDNLPVLIVKNYEDITLEFLENVHANMTKQTYDYRRLYKGYWQNLINSYRNFSELIQIQYTILK